MAFLVGELTQLIYYVFHPALAVRGVGTCGLTWSCIVDLDLVQHNVGSHTLVRIVVFFFLAEVT